MLRYDEIKNIQQLGQLETRARALFALMAATRILPWYQRFEEKMGLGKPDQLTAVAQRLWLALEAPVSKAELKVLLEESTALIPEEVEPWDDQIYPYAEDAAAAVVYSASALFTSDVQDAAWAGRRAYEAIDYFIRSRLTGHPGTAIDENVLLSSPLIQAELARQRRDLRDVEIWENSGHPASQLKELKSRSESESEVMFNT
jgi:uncharacterized protein YjaG (DUF416 family)